MAQQTNVDVISNNIANMNTTAYTKRRAEFNDLLYPSIIRQVNISPETIRGQFKVHPIHEYIAGTCSRGVRAKKAFSVFGEGFFVCREK